MEKTNRTGLVLEGGGMRGIFTAGVLDVFMENKIVFDGVIGVSAGAIHGCSMVSGQKGRSIRYYKNYHNDKRFMSFYNLIRTGDLVDEEFCYHIIPEELDPYDNDAFLKSETEFYVTCTNLETGKAEYKKMKDMFVDIDYLRASASMPYVSRIVEKDGMKLLDGGCSDSIPLLSFQKMGFQKNVVVLTRESGYRKKPGKKSLARLVYRKYPKFVRALENRSKVYNMTLKYIEKQEREGEIFVIRPEKSLTVGRMSHDEKEIMATYEAGRKVAESCLDSLKVWLEKGIQK